MGSQAFWALRLRFNEGNKSEALRDISEKDACFSKPKDMILGLFLKATLIISFKELGIINFSLGKFNLFGASLPTKEK